MKRKRLTLDQLMLIDFLFYDDNSISETSRITNINYGTVQSHVQYLKKGFTCRKELEDQIAKEKGFKNYKEHSLSKLKAKGFNSYYEYQTALAKSRNKTITQEKLERFKELGYSSEREYVVEMNNIRKDQPKNRALVQVIKSQLVALGKNQNWMAKGLNLSRQSISFYARGFHFPSVENLDRILELLQYDKSDFDFLVEKYKNN